MMTERWENESIEHLIKRRLDYMRKTVPDTISTVLNLELQECNEDKNEYVFLGTPAYWMINLNGTLHGGMGATFVDQAMGHVAFCLRSGPGICPTVDLNIKYHRPIMTDDKLILRVRMVSRTKSLMHMSCEVYRVSEPDKVCISSTATYFYKPDGKHL